MVKILFFELAYSVSDSYKIDVGFRKWCHTHGLFQKSKVIDENINEQGTLRQTYSKILYHLNVIHS